MVACTSCSDAVLVIALCLALCSAFRLPLPKGQRHAGPISSPTSLHIQSPCNRRSDRGPLTVLNDAKFNFLYEREQKKYLENILRRSVDGCKKSIGDGLRLLEVAFPENRKSDISVSESLDTNRAFTKEFVKSFSNYGKDLWVIFPDKKESNLAVEKWGESNPYTVTSIETAEMTIKAGVTDSPKLLVVINPGFNVEEWINLASLHSALESTRKQRGDDDASSATMVIINGNLDRLRNGYYPRFFYPGLTKVTDSFYMRFTQAFFLSPVAVGGDRTGAWLWKAHPEDWQLLVKNAALNKYETVATYEKEPEPKTAWSFAKKRYSDFRGGGFVI